MISNLMNMRLTLIILLTVKGVFAVNADGVESVSATEGDPVTLHTGVNLTHTSDLIQWEFGSNPRCSATFRLPQIRHIYDDRCNETFRDRLEFDQQTGSLTIRNITNTDSGVYQLKIISSNTIKKTFNISVTAVPGVNLAVLEPGRPLRWLIPVLILILILALTGMFLYCCWKKRRQDNQAVPDNPEEELQLHEDNRDVPCGDKWKTFKIKFWKNEIKQANQIHHQQV